MMAASRKADKRSAHRAKRQSRSSEKREGTRRNRRWKFPKPDTTGDFVFMVVDVIRHTELLKEVLRKPVFEFIEFDEMLKALPEQHIKQCIGDYHPGLRWDWAGDGGIYAFPCDVTGFDVYEFVIRTAEKIINSLDKFNANKNPNPQRPIKLRIAIDRDEKVIYRKDSSFRRSIGLNVASKLRVADDENSIAITANVYKQLRPGDIRSSFIPLPSNDETETDWPTTYIDAVLAKRSLRSKATRHIAADQPLFAAHCLYRAFAIDFGRGDLEGAAASIQEALTSLDNEERGRYYLATMHRFFKAWDSITGAVIEKQLHRPSNYLDRLAFLNSEPVRDYLKKEFDDLTAKLVPAVEYMQEQFDLIAQRYLGGPRSLATLEMTELLLRTGFSPSYENAELDRRLRRFGDELRRQRVPWTIDDECSLCTGRALSCLVLAKTEGDGVRQILDWISSLEPYRFCHLGINYTGAEKHEHAMHYAASVAQAAIDADGPKELLARIIGAFFPPEATSGKQLLDEWQKWRSEGGFWVGSYIFSMFLALSEHPRFFTLIEPHREKIKKACEVYLSRLQREARDARVTREKYLYALRENLATLVLGRKLGIAKCRKPADDVADIFQQKVNRVVGRDTPMQGRQRYPFDSSIDRTVRFLDNWLSYFESALLHEV